MAGLPVALQTIVQDQAHFLFLPLHQRFSILKWGKQDIIRKAVWKEG